MTSCSRLVQLKMEAHLHQLHLLQGHPSPHPWPGCKQRQQLPHSCSTGRQGVGIQNLTPGPKKQLDSLMMD
jgi:hypothetical protein